MISKLEQQILSTLLNHLDKRLSIHQISQILKKSYPNIYNKTNQLIDLKLLKKEKIGKATVCRLNIQNDLLRNILSHIDILKRDKKAEEDPATAEILKVLRTLPNYLPIFTAFSFDSYIGICVHNTEIRDNLNQHLQKHLSFHDSSKVIVFDKKALIKYIVPEIIAQKIILTNPENYYRLLSEIKSESLFD